MSPDASSGCQNALKYTFSRGSTSDPNGGAYSTPDLLVALRGPTCKRRKHGKKGHERRPEDKRYGQEGKEHEKNGGRRRGPQMIFLQGGGEI